MLAIVVDIIGAYLLAARIRTTWALVLCAVGLGVASAAGINLAIHFVTAETVGETMGRIVFGGIVHPIVSIIAVFVWRRRHAKSMDSLPNDTDREQRRQQALAAQRELVKQRETRL